MTGGKERRRGQERKLVEEKSGNMRREGKNMQRKL